MTPMPIYLPHPASLAALLLLFCERSGMQPNPVTNNSGKRPLSLGLLPFRFGDRMSAWGR